MVKVKTCVFISGRGSNLKNLESVNNFKNYEFVKGNISNKKFMEEQISKCDLVVNFAAESHVDRSIVNSKKFIHSNILGVHSILEVLREFDNVKLLQISTDEVFGSLKKGSATESWPFDPASPYAASKAAAEMLVKSYFKTYGSDVMITRCTNNYGPRQFPEKLIPKMIINIFQNKELPIYAKGKNSREWIHVNDHCEALLRLYLKGNKGESYNVGTNKNLRNIDVVKKILKICKTMNIKILIV